MYVYITYVYQCSRISMRSLGLGQTTLVNQEQQNIVHLLCWKILYYRGVEAFTGNKCTKYSITLILFPATELYYTVHQYLEENIAMLSDFN